MTMDIHVDALVRDLFYKTYPIDGPDKQDVIETHMQAAIDEATAPLRARISELERSLRQQNYEVCQTLGKALRYPWFKDDQVNFPGASRLDGVCTADHTPETLAAEAAKRIAKLEGLEPLIEELERQQFDAAISDRDVGTDPAIAVTKAYIRNILKGGAS